MAAGSPSSPTWPLHETLVELLRRLNQISQHAEKVDGLEFPEIERTMYHFWVTHTHEVDLHGALQLLVENGLVEVVEQPAYAWDRSRVVGERFQITTNGKAYLNRQVQESGRIA
jgi:hypothetical protein